MKSKCIHHLHPRKEERFSPNISFVLSREDPPNRSKKNRYIRGIHDEKRSSFPDPWPLDPRLPLPSLTSPSQPPDTLNGAFGLFVFTKKFL